MRARGQGAKRVRENDSTDMEQDEPRRDSGAASTNRELGTEHETREARETNDTRSGRGKGATKRRSGADKYRQQKVEDRRTAKGALVPVAAAGMRWTRPAEEGRKEAPGLGAERGWSREH